MKKILLLVIAGMAILFGLLGLANSLSQSEQPESTKVVIEQEPLITIWRLKQAVAKGQSLEREHFELVRLPESEANKLGIEKNMKFDLKLGSVYRQDLEAGDLAFNERIITPQQDGYVDFVIAPNRVPYAVVVQPESIVGGVINHGTLIDVLSLSLPTEYSLESADAEASRKRNMFVTPILTAVKVLQVNKSLIEGSRNTAPSTEVSLILELTRKQVATITVAKRISELEVHKSIGDYHKEDLHADAGDVLSNFKSVVEFRADTVTIN